MPADFNGELDIFTPSQVLAAPNPLPGPVDAGTGDQTNQSAWQGIFSQDAPLSIANLSTHLNTWELTFWAADRQYELTFDYVALLNFTT